MKKCRHLTNSEPILRRWSDAPFLNLRKGVRAQKGASFCFNILALVFLLLLFDHQMDHHDALLFQDRLCIEFDHNTLSPTNILENSRGDWRTERSHVCEVRSEDENMAFEIKSARGACIVFPKMGLNHPRASITDPKRSKNLVHYISPRALNASATDSNVVN